MTSSTVLEILRIFLVVLGGMSVIWGVYDVFGDNGSQSAVGSKKIIGGIAFMAISGFLMTWAINEVKKAEEKAGVKAEYISDSSIVKTATVNKNYHITEENVLTIKL